MSPERAWAVRTAIVGAALLLLAALFALSVTGAKAHNAPSGWAYPWACCSDRDCRPVACDTLEAIEDGKVRDLENGQIYEQSMVQSSGDSRCHVCTRGGKIDGAPICAFTVNSF